jgi:hypothetical protein
MKYRLTPGNIFFLLVLGVYIFYKNSGDPRSELGVSYIFFFSILVLLGDFFLQLFIKKYKSLFLVEIISIPAIIFLALIA